MKVAVLAAVVFIGGFLVAKMSIDFVSLVVDHLEREDRDNRD